MSEYIKRESVTRMVASWSVGSYIRVPAKWAEEELQKIQAADVDPVRHGRWADNREHDGGWICTACGEEVTICSCGKDKTWEFPYCPNCGAAMYGDDSDG